MTRSPFIALVAAAAVFWAEPVRAADGPPGAAGPAVGAPAPAFALTTLDGKRVDLETYRGKTLVVNAWATWCPPCRLETPDLVAASAKLGKAGDVAFLGVDTTEDAPIVRTYVAARGLTYPQALDPGGAFAKAYDVQAFPTTFVIDPSGVVRARYIDVVAGPQLSAFVAAARAGKNATIASPLQEKIDAALAPEKFDFAGDAPAVEAAAKKALGAIAAAEKLLDESDAKNGNATDFVRTRGAEAALRGRAIAALVGVGTGVSDKTLLPHLRGDDLRDREQWADAADAYAASLAADPNDASVLTGLALASQRLGNEAAAADAYAKIAALEPGDSGALIDAGYALAKAGRAAEANETLARAVSVASANVAAHPGQPAFVRKLGAAYLYAGRTFVPTGDPVHARAAFDELSTVARRLPANDERHDMYLEEAQEAIVALELGKPGAGAAVSLAPWTGADLPGSTPNTTKYRLVVSGSAGRSVALRADGVPKGWVASFCTDRLCAPFRVLVTLPAAGVKIVEFQLVPPKGNAPPPTVRVIANDGGRESSATT